MVQATKYCRRCDKTKSVSEFYITHSGKRVGKIHSRCKSCKRAKSKEWSDSHPGRLVEYRHSRGINRPLSEAKETPAYLGVYVAERALSKFFDNIQRMPTNNPKFDFLCGRGFKIDVKSSCLRRGERKACWEFEIKRNEIADYFLCLAFDNREDLNPMHVWLIPGKMVCHLRMLAICGGPKSLSKWTKYERPMDSVVACCSVMHSH